LAEHKTAACSYPCLADDQVCSLEQEERLEAKARFILLALAARLNNLRKNGGMLAKSAESIPQGLEAALILLL
jgi:hypothetical protein